MKPRSAFALKPHTSLVLVSLVLASLVLVTAWLLASDHAPPQAAGHSPAKDTAVEKVAVKNVAVEKVAVKDVPLSTGAAYPPTVAIQAVTSDESAATDDKVQQQELDQEALPQVSELDAISLRGALIGGDPRAPRIGKHLEPQLPTADDLASPAAYQAYSGRSRTELLQSFATAVPAKVSMLEAAIARAEDEGLPQADIAFARAKIAALLAMQQQTQTEAELLQQQNAGQ
ncbi:hypothetical protein [Shewanella sedimentimangrovi]|uniref:Phospholipase C accessory protein PlcR n=1 Tax=Shewanella sedimentimangrovi TaxID=2814293 RepID=A0ABX7QW40_9GAMM|nr:hypothetical protein [Shewanella sedimentimangrovi]QSX35716.1 hypothetical protein JYB85_10005 [Shewanella sedimentimangrovi]